MVGGNAAQADGHSGREIDDYGIVKGPSHVFDNFRVRPFAGGNM
jgi:hypothetical protein